MHQKIVHLITQIYDNNIRYLQKKKLILKINIEKSYQWKKLYVYIIIILIFRIINNSTLISIRRWQ